MTINTDILMFKIQIRHHSEVKFKYFLSIIDTFLSHPFAKLSCVEIQFFLA